MQDHLTVFRNKLNLVARVFATQSKFSISNNVFPEKEAEWFLKITN